MRERIDFKEIAKALLSRAEHWVSSWLPDGKRVGHEWVCASLSGGEGRSCSVNLVNGKWGDFSSGEQGGDLLMLYQAIHALEPLEAAREVMVLLGMATGDEPVRTSAPAPRAPAKQTAPRVDEGWRTQRPVPAHAPEPTFKHVHRRPEDVEHIAEYRNDEGLHGYVVRFRTSDGGKDPIPYTWCVSARDGAARWHWKMFDEPRPLYFPSARSPGGRTVILVEGEKKAGILQGCLDGGAPGIYCVASWPGGSKAWKKAGWSWLAGCDVIAWPDCDAKREKLPTAKRKEVADPLALQMLEQAQPMLPEDQQPGMAAMLGIGALLRDEHGCKVQLLPIPKPGAVADGWDCADAINTDGWDFDRIMAFLAQAYVLPAWAGGKPPAPTEEPAGGYSGPPDEPPPRDALAGAQPDDDDPFQEHIDFICAQLKCKPWDLGVNRKLLITALLKSSELEGCLGYNDLSGGPATKKPWPWRNDAGPLADLDDLRLGDWLSRQYKLKAASRAALAEAIDTVADMHHFHPIRDWLKSLQWDGKPRLSRWLMHVLAMEPHEVIPRRQHYLALMGRFMLMGLVARVMEPGIKFDYSPVFEGVTGMGKSTLVRTLVGDEYFSDTHFDIGSGKDGMEQLEGLWAYELSEMTAFKKADSEQVKQFFSSRADRFRGAYGRFVQTHKRQCVIFCTTNKRQYLYDLTGNRRFWPVWIDRHIRLAWLQKWRAQLFAEAYAAWVAGERICPTPEEEAAYFVPEQELRLVETTVQSKLYEMLTREGSPSGEGRASSDFNQHCGFVTLHGLVQALGADAAKSTSLLENQIRSWLEANGWNYGRETVGLRRRGYFRPAVWPPSMNDQADAPPDAGGAPLDDEEAGDGPARAAEPDGTSDDEPF